MIVSATSHLWLRMLRQASRACANHELRSIALIVAIAFAYSIFRDRFILNTDVVNSWGGIVLASAIAVGGLRIRYPDKHPYIGLLLRSIALVLVSYLALQKLQGLLPIDIEGAVPPPAMEFMLHWGAWVGVAAGLIGLWRPSALFLCCCIVQWQKLSLGALSSYYITWIDYLALVEVGQFLILCVMGGAIFRLIRREESKCNSTSAQAISFYEIAFLSCIAIHFANYFWSAVAKLVLEGGWTSWLLENPTHSLILIADEGGFLPLSVIPGAPDFVWQLFEGPGVALLNFVVLASQLVGVVAIVQRRSIVAITLFYDAQHLAIFLLTGIFFWKWMLLNIAIVAAAGLLRRDSWPVLTTVFCIVMVFAAPLLFTIARLGWYDTYSYNDLRVEALLENGEIVRVPSNYFLEYSVLFAQQYPGRPLEGHFSTLTYGTTVDYEVFKRANRCDLELEARDWALSTGILNAEKLIRAHHARILKSAENGTTRSSFNWYPHHIWSNPFLYEDAVKLDPADISAYRISVRSVCFIPSPSGPKRVEKKVSFHEIEL